jgi:DNA-3-methyladenine glycosylase
VTRALGIDRKLNATAAARASGLWIEDRGVRVPRQLVQSTPRIGVDYAGPVWAGKKWRFYFDPAKLSRGSRGFFFHTKVAKGAKVRA